MSLNGFVAVLGFVALAVSIFAKEDFGRTTFRVGVMLVLSAIARKIFLV